MKRETENNTTEPRETTSEAAAGVKFSNATINSLSSLGDTLKRIRARLISEGYTVEVGNIYKKGQKSVIVNT